MEISKIFDRPKIIGICGDINTGKSNLVYYLINELKEKYNLNLYTYGLRVKIEGSNEIFSLGELEKIKDSVVFIDEFINLFEVDNRNKKEQIENSLRLIAHNNNILVLIGLPENFKKFISAKINEVFYKKVTLQDFINGSRIKNNVVDYCGNEKGTTILNVKTEETILFNEKYEKIRIPYLEEYDTKKDNIKIIQEK